MTSTEKLIAIAKSRGWTDIDFYEDNAGPGFWSGYPPDTIGIDKFGEWDLKRAIHRKPLPDYLDDLNAIREVMEFHWVIRKEITRQLIDICQTPEDAIFASPQQLVDALLRALKYKL